MAMSQYSLLNCLIHANIRYVHAQIGSRSLNSVTMVTQKDRLHLKCYQFILPFSSTFQQLNICATFLKNMFLDARKLEQTEQHIKTSDQ